MAQYNKIKATYPDALLLFRVGDFYETFGEDAKRAASILGIVLTRRANGAASFIELAGFPHHSIDNYLPKLVRAGLRVAICDQLEDPKTVKTIVKRGVTELVSPGVSHNSNILVQKANNFLAAVFFAEKERGIAFLDISTGEFMAAEGSLAYIEKLIQSFRPAEFIYSKAQSAGIRDFLGEGKPAFAIDDWIFAYDYGYEGLLKHFEVSSLQGYGLEGKKAAIIAAGACLHYVHDARHTHVPHIASLSRLEESDYVWLDRFTVRNLELIHANTEGAIPLVDILDHTVSPMGARMLRKWMLLPLKDLQTVQMRHELVEGLLKNQEFRQEVAKHIASVGDLERLVSRIALQKASPRELLQLGHAMRATAELRALSDSSPNQALAYLCAQLDPLPELTSRLLTTLHPDAPVQTAKGNVIAEGVNKELDDLRNIAFKGKDYLLDIQKLETQNTGISSLKISFNSVFGYYFEVTHAHKDKVPAHWIRKQTLVNAERYITPELKEYEEKILGAEEKIAVLEAKLFEELLASVVAFVKILQGNAHLMAQLDVLINFAEIAEKFQYSRPTVNEGREIKITGGRHPVIEQRLPAGESYVPNDVFLDTEKQQIAMITGPNMAGKSALLRQTALIVLMAQFGCFVPAASAEIGLIDKLFTRVGASDNLSAGASTFMVEMNETASILNNLSDRSLILLDEIGRGTSTYDGISIAWSIAEFLHEHPKFRAKTLFATHYHELNDMEKLFPRIKNFNVSIREHQNKVIFLRKLVEGGSAHSFGIHVAKMAGMPPSVVQRAHAILKELELQRDHKPESGSVKTKSSKAKDSSMQLSIFSLDDPLLVRIRDSLQALDVNTLTPVEALMKLHEIKEWLK